MLLLGQLLPLSPLKSFFKKEASMGPIFGLKSSIGPDEDLSWTLDPQWGLISTQNELIVAMGNLIGPSSSPVESLGRP